MHRHSACEQVFNVLRGLGKAAFLGVGLKFLDIPACATKINKSLFLKYVFQESGSLSAKLQSLGWYLKAGHILNDKAYAKNRRSEENTDKL